MSPTVARVATRSRVKVMVCNVTVRFRTRTSRTPSPSSSHQPPSPPPLQPLSARLTTFQTTSTIMSTTTTPNDSPVHVQPLHNPSQAAHVVVPQAPLGNATNGVSNQAPGMGAKALLAKKMANQYVHNASGRWPALKLFVRQQPQVHITDRQDDDARQPEAERSKEEALYEVRSNLPSRALRSC